MSKRKSYPPHLSRKMESGKRRRCQVSPNRTKERVQVWLDSSMPTFEYSASKLRFLLLMEGGESGVGRNNGVQTFNEMGELVAGDGQDKLGWAQVGVGACADAAKAHG